MRETFKNSTKKVLIFYFYFQQIALATGADLPRRSKRSHEDDLHETTTTTSYTTTEEPVPESTQATTTFDWRISDHHAQG